MRDLDKERELLHKAGLVTWGSNDEALAAAGGMGGSSATVTAHLTTIRPETARSPVADERAPAATSPADDAVAELLRLGQEAAAHAEKLSKRIDPIAGKPDHPWRKNKLQLARNAAADMIERLLAFLDHVAGDLDVEDDDPGGGDPCDTDGPGSEGDDQEIYGEADLASTECIDQRHIGQGDPMSRDGEMNLASTNGIDQRLSWTGSRADREGDAFPYDEPRRQESTEPTSYARAETEAELRRRGLRGRREGEGNIVELSLWRR